MRSFLQILALSILPLLLVVSGAPAPESEPQLMKRAKTQGLDFSSDIENIDWSKIKFRGVQFVYIKATESTTIIDPDFNSRYNTAAGFRIIRGAYHVARPATSSGAAQAQFFLAHGGRLTPDGITLTLPGAINLEGSCSGLSASAMVNWIQDFSNTYRGETGRFPVISTTTSWWTSCTGNSDAFGANNSLWIINWADSIGPLPAGWSSATFWQYANSGIYEDLFIGDYEDLQRFVVGN